MRYWRVDDALKVMENSPREWFDAILNPAGLPWSVADTVTGAVGQLRGLSQAKFKSLLFVF